MPLIGCRSTGLGSVSYVVFKRAHVVATGPCGVEWGHHLVSTARHVIPLNQSDHLYRELP